MSVSAAPAQSEWTRTALIAVTSAAFIVTISMGTRQSFGLLMQPIGTDIEISRAGFGFAIALQNLLFGLVQPFVGALSDRFGARRTLILGAVLYAIGLSAAAYAQTSGALVATFGVMIGLAMSATTFVVVLSAVGRLVAPAQRSVAFGIVTAGGSLGQFLVVPLAQGLIGAFGWRSSLLLLAILLLSIIVAAFGIRGDKAPASGAAGAGAGIGPVLRAASRHPHYWLLNGGFFVCGFHVAFVGTHLPAYLVDSGLGAPVGAWSLALIGLFNILGSYLFGVWGGSRSRPRLLAQLYFARAVAIVVFLAVPLSPASSLVFAATFGFLWLGTVPLTSGAVASMFGITHLSALFGIVFLSHQVGAFLGAWWAGELFERTGSYDAVWYTSIALALIAAGLSAVTRDHALPSPGVAAAQPA
jgi:predicted MFS family arabinose efflux permease